MPTDLTTLKFEIRDRVANIRLSRPEAANGFNLTMATELAHDAQDCDLRSDVKAVLLTGEGSFFSARGDLKSMAAAGDNSAREVKRIADALHRAISTFQRMDAPLVVAVNGTCAGAGFGLALAGDMVLAASSARFTMAHTRAGLSPDGGSTDVLPRRVGLHKAQELMFTNRVLTGKEAYEWGLVTNPVDDADHDGLQKNACHSVVLRLSLPSLSDVIDVTVEGINPLELLLHTDRRAADHLAGPWPVHPGSI